MAGDTVTIKIAGDDRQYTATLKHAEDTSSKSGSVMKGIFQGVGIGIVGLAQEAGGQLLDFLGGSVKAAEGAQVAQVKLAQAFKNTGQAMSPAELDAYTKAQEKLGFTNTETTDSLAKLATAGLTVADAEKTQAIAEDLARARGISLADATTIMVKAHEGNLGALKKLGIVIAPVTAAVDALRASHVKITPEMLAAAKAADTHANAQNALAAILKATGGQASAYAGTMSGEMAVASSEVNDAQEKLGATLGQIATAVLPGLVDMLGQAITVFENVLTAVQPVVAEVVTNLTPAFTWFIANVVPELVSALDWVSKNVMPALSAAVSWFAKNVMPVIVSALEVFYKKILPALANGIDWITKNVIPPLVAAFGIITKTVFPVITAAINIMVNTVLPALSKAFGAVADFVGRVFGGISGVIKGIFNGVIDAVNFMIGAIDAIQVHIHAGPVNIDFNGVGIQKLPRFHAGGIVPGAPGSEVLAVLQAGEHVTRAGGGGGGVTVVIQGGMFLDNGPSLDLLANAIARRLRYTTQT